jgi:hypothetical protein
MSKLEWSLRRDERPGDPAALLGDARRPWRASLSAVKAGALDRRSDDLRRRRAIASNVGSTRGRISGAGEEGVAHGEIRRGLY